MLMLIINGLTLVVALTTVYLGFKIMSAQSEAAAKLDKVTDQLVKVQAEIQNLIDTASNEEVSEELQAAIDRVTSAAQMTDDKIADTPPPAPV